MKLMHLSPSQNLSEDRFIIVIMQGSPTTSLFDLPGSNMSHQDGSTMSPPELDDVSVQAYIAFAIILILFLATFLGNILIITSVAKYKRLQIPPNYILINMAMADLGVAVMTLVLYTFSHVRDISDESVACLIPYSLMSLFSGVSVLSLSVIAYDRFSALVEPLKYSSRITSFRIIVICVAVWFYVTLVSTIPLIGWFQLPAGSNHMERLCSLNFYQSYTALGQVLAIFLPAVVCMFFCYCRVMLVARHHTRAISAVQFSLFPGVLKNYNTFKGNKYWRTLALILGVFTLTWGTFTISIVIEVFCEKCAEFLQFHHYSGLLLLLNSSLNPWIYAYRNQDFRAAFSRILRCFTKPCKKGLSQSNPNLVGERRNSRMSVALSRTNSMCGNLQTLQMLYEQDMALKNNNQPNFKDGEVETKNTSVNNSKVSVKKDVEKEPENKTSPIVEQTIPEV